MLSCSWYWSNSLLSDNSVYMYEPGGRKSMKKSSASSKFIAVYRIGARFISRHVAIWHAHTCKRSGILCHRKTRVILSILVIYSLETTLPLKSHVSEFHKGSIIARPTTYISNRKRTMFKRISQLQQWLGCNLLGNVRLGYRKTHPNRKTYLFLIHFGTLYFYAMHGCGRVCSCRKSAHCVVTNGLWL